MDKSLVRPARGPNDPLIGPVAVLAAVEADLTLVRALMGTGGKSRATIFASRLYQGADQMTGMSVAGPILGAPYAAMVLEKMIVLGATKFVFLGWCGSVQPYAKISDLVVVESALSDEGTSGHYMLDDQSGAASEILASKNIVPAIETILKTRAFSFQKGSVLSTDAPYRETRDKVLWAQEQGVVAVDMELAALFAVARFHSVDLGALLVVSDELGTLKWQQGFSRGDFKDARKKAANVVCDVCRKLL